jgi:hypothetical protein
MDNPNYQIEGGANETMYASKGLTEQGVGSDQTHNVAISVVKMSTFCPMEVKLLS